jgi:UDP-glucose 4-epimerase
MSSVLITGVTGFLGRYLARQFFQAGWTVLRDFQRKKRSTITLVYTKYPQTTFRDREALRALNG